MVKFGAAGQWCGGTGAAVTPSVIQGPDRRCSPEFLAFAIRERLYPSLLFSTLLRPSLLYRRPRRAMRWSQTGQAGPPLRTPSTSAASQFSLLLSFLAQH